MSETTFDFGFGPVQAHRHANGGGWVADTATVAETAYVGPEARVYDKARVCGEAQVFGEARVFDNALVCDNARVYGEARVCGEAQVFDNAQVYGKARICDKARVRKTPLLVTGYEFTLTIVDNRVQVGCQTIGKEALSSDLFPEEHCPRLRAAATYLIPMILAHWEWCKEGAQP